MPALGGATGRKSGVPARPGRKFFDFAKVERVN